MIVTGCPMCHSNLDMRQRAMQRRRPPDDPMPILYLSELLGLAAGIAPKAIGLDRHFTDAMSVVRKECLTMARVGVFICHCGENIARTVDVAAAAAAAAKFPGVVYSVDYKYMCSDPGQQLIRKAIADHKLTGVVVAACSPRMHENTFRRAAAAAGLNPYLLEMANVREHCAWVHGDRAAATAKAIDLIRVMVEKVKRNRSLNPITVPVEPTAVVIGGGIAGIQAALDIAAGGKKVVLLEKSPSIGGHMARLSETFPTLDCSQCILTPRMVEAANHPNITLMTYSEVESVGGFVGNFEVTVRRKARYVDPAKCTGCGDCWNKCPSKNIPSEFDAGLGTPDGHLRAVLRRRCPTSR